MSHKFDPKNLVKLDNPERRKNFPPDKILELLKIEPGSVIADIGAGIGYFTFPASLMVGAKGEVFALDTSRELLLEIKKRASKHPLRNIKLIHSQEDNLKIPDQSIDFALLSLVLHEAKDPARFLFLTHQALKPGGKVAILEWEKQNSTQGPKLEDRLSKEKILTLLQEYEFHSIQELPLSREIYVLSAVKS